MGTKTLDQLFALEEQLAVNRRWMKEMVDGGQSEVANFYEGAVVFVTGGSGFLGKQLIEKLIRSCRVAKVYMLLRAKKGKQLKERLHKILQGSVFDSLREEQPNFADKIIPIEGDVADLKIGIADNDWRMITEEINIIFHAAASTHFELPLKFATLINVRGTREVLGLAKACQQLKSMVYVSTAYTHATKSHIDGEVLEEFYTCPMTSDAIIQLAETQDQNILDCFMNIFRKEWPNTYTFTKALAEEVIRSMSEDVPVCVIRPAIVIGAMCEPRPGWLDFNALHSASGILLGLGLGLIHTFYLDMKKYVDLIPVDYANNAAIAAAKYTANRHASGNKNVQIYTLSNVRNMAPKCLLENVADNEARDIVPPAAVWYACAVMIANRQIFTLLTWLFHYIPAMLIDVVLALRGSKLRLLEVYKKVYNISIAFEYFNFNNFKLDDQNTMTMYDYLSEVDKKIFTFDLELVIWKEYYIRWLYGIRKYVVRDGLKDTVYAKKKQFCLRILHYIICALYAYVICNFIYYLTYFIYCIYSVCRLSMSL